MNNKKALKECKYCKSLIDADAKVCPDCKKSQDSKTKSFVLGILIAIMIISIGGLIFFNKEITRSNPNQYNEENIPEEDIQAQIPENTQSNLSLGQSCNFNGLEATVNSISEWDGGDTMYKEDLSSGEIYLLISVTVRNNSDEDQNVYDLFMTGFVDGRSIDSDLVGENYLSGQDLIPGTYATGDVAFVVPQNWNSFQLRIEDWGNEQTAVYSFDRNQLSSYSHNNHHNEYDHN